MIYMYTYAVSTNFEGPVPTEGLIHADPYSIIVDHHIKKSVYAGAELMS